MVKRELILNIAHLQKLLHTWKNKYEDVDCKRDKLEQDLKKAIEAGNGLLQTNKNLMKENRRMLHIVKHLTKSLSLTYCPK
jgi:hypothetical protein